MKKAVKKPVKKPAVESWKWEPTSEVVETMACCVGKYELIAWIEGDTYCGRVDSMMLIENPLNGQTFETMQLAQIACQDAVLRIERETLELQRMAGK